MNHSLELLRAMPYPGRLIALGRDPSDGHDVVVYGVTGRSPSSQARLLEPTENAIVTKPTDPEVLKTGNPDLLVYPAVVFGDRLAVSNGRQTEDAARAAAAGPAAALEAGLRNWTYEPDAPIFTPRISGLLWPDGRAALGVIKRAEDGSPRRLFFEFNLQAGRAELVATYAGPNENPLPVFAGEPRPLTLAETSAEATAEAFYEALGPKHAGDGDFRVAVACVFVDRKNPARRTIAVRNRHERKPA